MQDLVCFFSAIVLAHPCHLTGAYRWEKLVYEFSEKLCYIGRMGIAAA